MRTGRDARFAGELEPTKVSVHRSNCYAAVFYIDGNDEHRYRYHELGESYRDLAKTIGKLQRVTYLQENVIIIDGVADCGRQTLSKADR